MKATLDRETGIVGLGITLEEAMASMRFYIERSGRISAEREIRRKDIHAWLPRPYMLHVKGVGAILYEDNYFKNMKTGRKVRVQIKPLAHYLCLYSAFDGELSFEDFTLTIAPEVNQFLKNISDKFLTLNDFPYIKPVESLDIMHYHATVVSNLSIIETTSDTIVAVLGDVTKEVDKTLGVDSDCLLAYLLASMGFCYDGHELRRIHEN